MLCGSGEEFCIIEREAYLHCPEVFARTKLTNNALEKVLGVKATSCNLNTINKLCELAAS